MADIKKAYTLCAGDKIFALDIPKVEYSGNATILPNVYNVFGSISGKLVITKGEEKPNVTNAYFIRVIAGYSLSIVFHGWELKWIGAPPNLIDGSEYEISIIDNLALVINT